MNSNRIIWIDLAKAFGIFLVVIGHLISTDNLVGRWIYSFHMPFFFFLSGLCFSNKYNFTVFVKRKFKSLIIPYLYIGLIISVLYLFIYSFEDILNNIRHHFFNYGAMWFIPVLFFTEILFFPITRIKNKVIILILIFISFVVGYLISDFKILSTKVFLLNSASTFLALFFYGLGFLGKNILNKILSSNYKYHIFIVLVACHWMFLILSGTAINIQLNLLPNPIYNCCAAISGLLAFCLFSYIFSLIIKKEAIIGGLIYIGQNTLVILCFHMLFIDYSINLIRPLIDNHLIYNTVEFIFVWILCFSFIYCINKFTPWIINRKKAFMP
ncbi:hypothetical protein D0T53_04750 [Dysgonomonas sp. 216]|uniref:acyltransferase family protein n=1 Tax=Dysgonomonas sp. 216 TaxID=2302934 RepID=UPI0013D09E43|nr:hypothetical protein [Dysgonomonas sp. 216]